MSAQFIVIEGIDGAGTTTQVELLGKALLNQGKRVLTTCEPTTGKVGRFLRGILSQAETLMSKEELALLFTADRMEHVREVISPAHDAKQVVVCDRYYHSTLAYQLKPDSRNLDWLYTINQPAIRPAITFFLDVSVETALSRLVMSGRDQQLFETKAELTRIKRNYQTVICHLQKQGEMIAILNGEDDPKTILDSELKIIATGS